MTTYEKVKNKLNEHSMQHEFLPVSGEDISIEAQVDNLGITYSDGVSTLIYRVGGSEFVAVLRRDDRKIDSKALKKAVGSSRISFANSEELSTLGFQAGLVSPLALPEQMRVFIDETILKKEEVICGSGAPDSVLKIKVQDLISLFSNKQIVEITSVNEQRSDNFDSNTKKRILTGVRPTGPLHVGHYVGFLENVLALQNSYDVFVMIADLQGLTDNHENPEKIHTNTMQVAQDILASGFDYKKNTLFVQSSIPEIAELSILFLNLVTANEVLKNPTVKTEIKEKGLGDKATFGFVAHPITQAADIHFCRSHMVPVGIDQAPMLELSRTVAKRFNRIYKTDLFNETEPKYSEVQKLVGTDGNPKMSKSLKNTINLNMSKSEVEEMVKGMYTDPNRIKATDPGTVEGNPVFIYHDVFNQNKEEVSDLKARYKQGKVGDVEVKEKLSIAINQFLEPIREARSTFTKAKTKEILIEGNARAKAEAEYTMEQVRDLLKLNL